MTVPKSVLIAFAFLLMGGTGAAMYVGVQVGLANAETEPTAAQPASALKRGDAPPLPEEVRSHEELCPEELAVEAEEYTEGTRESESSRWSDTTGTNAASETGNFATNSGLISGSQFNDGGFGDIGQQWWNVSADGDIITVNIANGGTGSVNTGTGPGSTAVPDTAAAAADNVPAVEVPAVAADAPQPSQPAADVVTPDPNADTSPAADVPEGDAGPVGQTEPVPAQPVELPAAVDPG